MFDKSYSGDAAIAASQSAKEREYWLEKLSGELAKSYFPYDNKESMDKVGDKHCVEVRFTGELFSRLAWISNRSDTRLLTVLAGGLLVLINKYTDTRDIIVGMPIYKQEVEGNFINTVVPLRCLIREEMTFKELLYRVKQTIDDAIKHQNYPIKTLLYDLNLTFSQEDFPLFDILLMLKNIQDSGYMRHIPVNMEFIFFRTPEYLEVAVRYNPFFYDKETVERIVNHFYHLLNTVIFNVDLSLAGIDILPEEEKKKLLEEFNRPGEGLKDHPDKTIHGLFAEQVEKTPDRAAVVFVREGGEPELFTYRDLDEKARVLAGVLKEKGIAPEHIAALLIESSLHMAAAVLAVLKAGGAYLPIDMEAPEERKAYILKDSRACLLLTANTGDTALCPAAGDIEQLDVTGAGIYTQSQPGETRGTVSGLQIKPAHPAYIIYTSGSTGKPKGVIVEHCQAVNTLVTRKQEYGMNREHTALQLFSYAFDGFITSFFTPVISGARVILLCKDTIQDISEIVEVITAFRVTHFISVPVLFQALLTSMTAAEAASLRVVTLAGDKVQPRLVEMAANKNKNLEVVNEYGVTEAAVMSTIYRHQEKDRRVKIGHPIDHTRVYITKSGDHRHLAPIGVFGEMCIAGAGITRGYMNKPELTAEKFLATDEHGRTRTAFNQKFLRGGSGGAVFSKSAPPGRRRQKLYKTGDLARWLPDGNIEFGGRIDFQVKVRGFRIELGEIERRLLTHEHIKETIVTALENDDGDKYLCAYMTCARQLVTAELREYLVGRLPEYMIPAYFVILEKMPLSPNGKVNRKQLPHPSAVGIPVEYAPPRTRLEKQLVEIWADLLGIEKDSISIEANFFELGGHSLKATLLVNRIIKEFNVRIAMVEIFKSPDIRSTARLIKGAMEDIFVSINPAEGKDYYPLSPGQRRLFILYQMDFNSLAYNVSTAAVLGGNADKARLERVFRQLIARHESLRTSFTTIGEQPVQIVHRDVDPGFKIEYYSGDSSDNLEITNIVNHFVRPFDLSRAPLLRVGLVKLSPVPTGPTGPRGRSSQEGKGDEYLLLVDMHHIITDGVSHKILIENFMNLCQGRGLPPLRLQYKDYSQWQQGGIVKELLRQQEEFWMRQLAGEIPTLAMPTDFPRPALQSFAGNVLDFRLGQEQTNALREIAESQRATLFMVLLAIYNIFLSKISHQEDIVMGTPVAGRRHADLEQIIGVFINMLPLRNAPRGEITFTAFLRSLTEKTIEAFDHQDYAFEDLVEKVVIDRDLARNPVFDVVFVMQNMFDPTGTVQEHETGDLTIKPYENQERKAAQFDLTLYTSEVGDILSFTFEYCTSLFKEETIARFIQYFNQVTASVIENPDKNISHIEIISEEEKVQVLKAFNATEAEYPVNETISRLFVRQVEQSPDNIAVIAPWEARAVQLSYFELNERSGRLALWLREKGVEPDTIVGIMVERSLDMIIGIIGILKSGGAYLPIDPEYPEERINYMLADSGATLLITTSNFQENHASEKIYLPLDAGDACNRDACNRDACIRDACNASLHKYFPGFSPANLAYIIYTSGSTAKPKGVMIEHTSVVNLLFALQRAYPFIPTDAYLLKTSYVFDVSVTELFGWYMGGGRLVILEKGGEKDPQTILASLERNRVTHVNFVPSMFNIFIEHLTEKNGNQLSGLKYIFLAGEALLQIWVKKFRDLGMTILLENIYGPTESTVYASQYSLAGWEGPGPIPIGKPLPNLSLYILDKNDCIQPINIVGELCISGIGLARGYLNQPGLTAEKFKRSVIGSSKISQKTNDRLYFTGDLARWLSSGEIEFLGRMDNQVKIRGFRIELGEIEIRLLEIENIREAVVVERKETDGGNYLCAYIVTGNNVDIPTTRQTLNRMLPDYMIPSYFVQLGKIPLTPSGKIDRKSLPDPVVQESGEYVQPGNRIEKILAKIWCEELGLKRVSIDANFFHLGGHSLKATTMCAKVNKELNVRVSIMDVFKTPTIRGLAQTVKELAEDKFTAIEHTEEKEYYALSSAQERLYFLRQIDTGGISYNLSNILMLEPDTCEKKISETFRKLIARHESLRTSFEIVAGGAVQRIHDEAKPEIGHYEIEDRTELEKIIRDFVRPFDLDRVPLVRISLVNANGTGKSHKQKILLFDMHHIISDGISQGILIREFMQLYAGEELPPLRLQYRDYSQWQHRLAVQEVFKSQEDFWLLQFTGEIPLVNLPYDYPRPAEQSFAGSVFMFTLEETHTKALNEIARTRGVTLFMVLLAAYNIFLCKLSRQEDIVVGCPVAGRRHADLEQIIGMFVNTLALRNHPLGEKTFAHFLKEVRKNTLAAFDNQDYPFEDLVEKVDIPRDLSRNPLFDIGFVLQNMYEAPTRKSTPLTPLDYKGRASRFDLSLIITETAGKLDLTFEYCTRLFKENTIVRFTRFLKKIISSIIENPQVKISGIDILTETEKNRVLYEFNRTTAEYPREKTIHELFQQQAAKMNNRIALTGMGDFALSYGELNEQSAGLAYVIQSKGVGPNTIVGIMPERSVEMIIGILGILKSGGAYLPIDPDYPADRIQYMLKDSSVRVLVTAPKLQVKVKAEVEENFRTLPQLPLQFINLETRLESTVEPSLSTLTSTCQVSPANLAYVIYTSGSTGKPKGVMVAHRNVVRLVKNAGYIHYSIKDRLLPTGSVAFDITTFEIWGPLLNGIMSSLVPKEIILNAGTLKDVLVKHDISILHLIPQLFNRMAAQDIELFAGLRYFLVGGDLVRPEYVTMLRQRYSNLKILHMYGPTENTTFSTFFPVDRNYEYNIPIGRPIRNSSAFIIDKYGHLQPTGVTGELCVGGEGLARGYLNQPELTSEKFIRIEVKDEVEEEDIPGEPIPNKHMSYMSYMSYIYLTGDLARWLFDGNIEFLGRIDQQVKIRGFRVELGEIENRLANIEGIKESVVSVHEEVIDDKYICAYFVSDRTYGISELREYLAKELPDYMIPSYFIQVEKIPLTPNGKVDRKSLPKPGLKVSESYTAPRNEIEKKLVELWSEILGRDALHASQLQTSLGIDDNFFELGGHSLKATILVSKLHKVFDVRVPLAEIFKRPGIKELANYIKEKSKEYYISIKPVEEKEYYLLSSAQKRFYVMQQIGDNNTAYNMFQGFPLSREVDKEKLVTVFNRLIARHETLRTSFEVVEGEPVQKIHDKAEWKLHHYKTDEIGLNNVIDGFSRPFDLSKAPLLRVGLVEIEAPSPYYYLLVEMHHIISEEVSQTLLQKEFLALSSGRELSPLRLQYKDFAEWENSRIHQEALKKQENYWLKQFDGELPVLNLPLDVPRPPVQSYDGCTVSFHLPLADSTALRTIALQEGATLFMVLLTVYNIFLAKICSQEDIIVGAPVAGRKHSDLQKMIGVFINSLALRNFPGGEKTVREFLNQVKTNTMKAFENQEYPFEDLVEKVTVERDASRNPIFDVMLNLLNPEDYLDLIPANSEEDEDSYTHVRGRVRFDMNLVAVDFPGRIFCVFYYCTALFKPETIERFIGYLKKIVSQLPGNLDRRTVDIDILSEAEKQRLLLEFNAYAADYPRDKAIIQLFEEQVSRTPDNAALVFEDNRVTYRQLNEQANRLGRLLRSNGAAPDTLVSLMVQRSVEMVVGIWGILKSGGAYLPVSPEAPADRITYMLDNASVNILLTQETFIEKFAGRYQVINLNSPDSYKNSGANPGYKNAPTDLAYVIYTSGSTGKPKGVMIQNRSVINIVKWFAAQYHLHPGFQLLQMFEYTFDASINQIFGSLLHGVTLHVIRKEYFFDIEFLRDYLISRFINLINFVQSVIKEVLCGREKIESLKYVISGAEKLKSTIKKEILDNGYRLYNQYGPTEVTVDALAEKCSYESNGTVGVPVYNARCYIVNAHGRLNPVGTAGELWVSGDGLARGYINNVELTREKFIPNPFIPGKKVYRTGDLTRWLQTGNVEFLGRTDTQVKIRGFRIEPVEIANQLVKIHGIKEAVVIDREDDTGETYLCAYLVGDESADEIETGEIKNTLSRSLPDYMIPSYYVRIPRLPLSGHGKLIRSALPKPGISASSVDASAAPANDLERNLVEIWSEVLNIDKQVMGINSDFFELGGHSLKATILVSRLHKKLNVKIPLAEVFVNPTIREMEQVIIELTENKFEAIKAMEKKEYYVLSPAQKRLYFLQQMDTESIAYNLPHILPIGNIDKKRLEDTFQKLVSRHESFRTSFEMLDEVLVQKVHGHDHIQLLINYYTIESQNESDGKIAGIINKFVNPFDLSQAPLLRLGLIEKEAKEFILMVDVHHILTDGTSHNILIKEFFALYARKELPRLRIQYKDYSEWQQSRAVLEELKKQEEYWLKEFKGEIPVLGIPTDYPRPVVQSFEGDSVNFEISAQETRALKTMALKKNSTLFMVLVAVVNVFLSKLSGQEEIIIGTPIAGRRHADLEKIIGMFVNTLALRNYPAGHQTYEEFLADVKERVLMVFENQDYPFENLVEKAALERDLSRNPLFDIMFILQNMDTGSLALDKESEFKPMQAVQTGLPEEYENIVKTAQFDLTLGAMEKDQGLIFSIQYCTKLFKKETIERFIIYFKKIISIAAKNPGIMLSEIVAISEEEKNQVLYMFNDTEAVYPKDKSIHQLFEDQVNQAPDLIALIGPSLEYAYPVQLSYQELNKRAGQLAYRLHHGGLQPEYIVGIMVDRSVEMMVGIMGILKSGAVYLPIDHGYPKERIKYMLADSNVGVLATTPELQVKVKAEVKGKFIEIIDISNLSSFSSSTLTSTCQVSAANLAYVIYTSGSTGKPKGVMIEHRSVINFIKGITDNVPFTPSDSILSLTTLSFDIFGLETILPITTGSKVVMGSQEEQLETSKIALAIEREHITIFQVIPTRLKLILSDKESSRVLKRLKYLLVGGEEFPSTLLEDVRNATPGKIYNVYGPTETTIWSTIRDLTGEKTIDIGKPIANTQVYILNKYDRLQPIGVPGELYIGGAGLARGYINRPGLTAEKFDHDEKNNQKFLRGVQGGSFYKKRPPGRRRQKLYKTGDLALWLPDGNIEFLGRIDQQVKIRGFRVELGEIENRLLNHPLIKEAVVLVRGEEAGDKYLCAYTISDTELGISELREYLTEDLPHYMIPSYFIRVEKLPLTPAGKLDRKALPDPEIQTGSDHMAPRDQLEESLAKLWSEGLNIEKNVIGINSNFFELGGHSLKATILITKIFKEFHVKFPLQEVFKTPNIKGMAGYIRKAKKQENVFLESLEKKEYYPASSQQKRLFILQQGHLNLIAYNRPNAYISGKELDKKKLETTFRKLIQRHESLRTSFDMIDGETLQRIHGDVPFAIEYDEGNLIRDSLESFVRPFDLALAPLLRVRITKTANGQNILMVDIHHIISDGISDFLLISDFMAFYQGKQPPALKSQYKDFSHWQIGLFASGEMKKQEIYWLETFAGKIPKLAIPKDYTDLGEQSFEGSGINFELDHKKTAQLNQLAKREGITLFMLLLAVYNVLLAKLGGQDDIVVGIGVAGRRHADFEKVIGMFVNTLALRNYPADDKTFKEFLHEVKEQTLLAFENQDYLFENLVEKVVSKNDTSRNPIFDTSFIMQNMESPTVDTENLDQPELMLEPYGIDTKKTLFDLSVFCQEIGGKLGFGITYSTALFKKETIEKYFGYYQDILSFVLENKEITFKLKDIRLASGLKTIQSTLVQKETGDFGF